MDRSTPPIQYAPRNPSRSKVVSLFTEHAKLSEKICAIAEQKKDKAERRRRIEIFLRMLEEQKECADFETGMFVALVDKVVIQQDGHLEFCFRNGMQCEYPQ